jgi:HSP20 family protein
MAMSPWEPFADFTSLRDAMSHLFDESVIAPRGMGGMQLLGRAIPVDVREMENEYVIEASLPGWQPDEVEVAALPNAIAIRAKRQREQQREEQGRFVRRERIFDEVTRTIPLPGAINPEHVTASFENGVLKLHAPKAEGAKAKQVTIQSGQQTGQIAPANGRGASSNDQSASAPAQDTAQTTAQGASSSQSS